MAQLAREVVLGQTSGCTDPQEFTRITPVRSHHSLSRSSRLSFVPDEVTPLSAATICTETETEPLFNDKNADSFSRRVRLGINASWFVNVVLLVAKTVAFAMSGSYAVLASAVDSLVDILSQAVLAVAEYQAARFHQRFPIGRTRVAELSVLACAAIMFVSTALVIRESVANLWDGLHGHLSPLNVDVVLICTLAAATALKLLLFIYCRTLRKNPIMVALSEDHLNDVFSNLAAIGGAAVAGNVPRFWWVDPAVAVLFSLLIIRNWMTICWEQGQKMIGLEAPEELIQEVTHVTENHCLELQLDRVIAYHHGSHMVVEVEVLLPADMSVRESHDIALALQHKIEAIDSVERAFVHVDYERRVLEEHKVERNLKMGVKDVMKPLPGYSSSGPSSLEPAPNAVTSPGPLACQTSWNTGNTGCTGPDTVVSGHRYTIAGNASSTGVAATAAATVGAVVDGKLGMVEASWQSFGRDKRCSEDASGSGATHCISLSSHIVPREKAALAEATLTCEGDADAKLSSHV